MSGLHFLFLLGEPVDNGEGLPMKDLVQVEENDWMNEIE